MRSVAEWKAALRAQLREALRARKVDVVTVLREAMAAIDNAEAPPANEARATANEVFAGSVAGVGAGEVPRLLLSPGAVAAIIDAEIGARRDAAREYAECGRDKEASTLLSQADVLEELKGA